jgi:hypothetical protein
MRSAVMTNRNASWRDRGAAIGPRNIVAGPHPQRSPDAERGGPATFLAPDQNSRNFGPWRA